jgi:hypothetical protein
MPLPLITGLAKYGLATEGLQAMGGALVGVVKTLGGLPWKLEAFGEGLIAGKDGLRRFSGEINAAFARLEVGTLISRSGQAKVTAGSTATLVDGVLDLKKTLAPWQAIFTNGFNKISTVFVNGLTSVLTAMESIPGIGEEVKRIREEMEREEGTPTQSLQFLNDIAAGRLSGRVTDRITAAGPAPKRKSPVQEASEAAFSGFAGGGMGGPK